MQSALEVTTNKFYSNLDRLDKHTIRRMAIAHRNAIKSLNVEFARIQGIIAKDKKLGLDSGAYVLQNQRLASFIVQARSEFEKFGSVVGEVLSETQLDAVKLAEQQIPNFVEAINGPAPVGYAFNRFPRAALTQMVGHLSDGSPLATLTKSFGDDAAGKLNAILANGMALGRNPLVIARQMRDVAGTLGIARARTIARTEMLRAYRESSRRTMLANQDVVQGWRWHSALDDRTCAVCYAMHGRTFKLHASMATHPNCRCVQIPITKSWKELGFSGVADLTLPYKATVPGETWFKGLSKVQQRKVLGKGGQLAYEKGLVKLDDFVQDTYSAQWGYGRTTRSLRSIVGTDNARLLSRGIVPTDVQPNLAKLRLPLVEDNPFLPQLDFLDDALQSKKILNYEADALKLAMEQGTYANAAEFQAAIEGVMDAPYQAFEQMLDDAVAKYGFDPDIADAFKAASKGTNREELNALRQTVEGEIANVKTAFEAAWDDAMNQAVEQLNEAHWLGNIDQTSFDMWWDKAFDVDKTTPIADWNALAQDMAAKNFGTNPVPDIAKLVENLHNLGAIDDAAYQTYQTNVIGAAKTYTKQHLDSIKDALVKQADDWAPINSVYNVQSEWAKVTQLANDGKLSHTEYMNFASSLVGKPKIKALEEIDNFVNDPKWLKVTKSSKELLDELNATYMPYADKQTTIQLYKSKAINKEQMQDIIDNAVKTYTAPPPPPPAVPTMPAVSSAATNFTPPALSELTFVKDLGGSTGARLFEDTVGKRYVVKKGNSLDHLLSESRADDIYHALGIDVPKQAIVNGDTKVAEFLDGKVLNQLSGAERAAAEAKIRENFVADSLMGNWDVIGLNADNILVDTSGKVWRIDNGGALSFRAQGAKKAANQWNEVVSELDTFRSTAKNNATTNIFKHVTDDEIVKQIDAIVLKRQAIWDAAINTSVDDAEMLMKRLDYLEKWAKQKKATLPTPVKTITQHIEIPPAGLLDETDALPFLDFAEQAGYITDVEKAAFLGQMQSEGWTSIKVASETTKFLKSKGVPHNAISVGKPFRIPAGKFDNSVDAWKAVNEAYANGLVKADDVKNLANNGIVNLTDPDDVTAAKLHAWLKSQGIPESVPAPQAAFATVDDALEAAKDAYYQNKITYTQLKKIREAHYKVTHSSYYTNVMSNDDFILMVEKRLGIKRPKPLKAAKTPYKKHVDKMDTLLKSNKINQRQYDFILDQYATGNWANKDIEAILAQYDKVSGAPTPGLPARFIPHEGPNWYQHWDYDGFMGPHRAADSYKSGRGYAWFKKWKQSVGKAEFDDTRLYTDDYASFNRWLREGRQHAGYNQGEYTRRIANMEKAFQSDAARTPEEMVVYRKTNIRDNHIWWNAKVGDTIWDDAVMSTSVGTDAAFSGSVRLVAYVPEDANAIWIAPESYHKSEREVIFKPGQQWLVHHVEVDTSGYDKRLTLVVEYIETP